MVDARVGTQLASLLPALFSCDDAVGMVQTFDTEEQAFGWLSSPVAPLWVAKWLGRSSTPPLVASETSTASSTWGLCDFACFLSTTGGYVAKKKSKIDVVQLLNTLSVLHGEVVLVFSSSTMSAAKGWMQRPVLSPWLRNLVRQRSADGTLQMVAPDVHLVDSDSSASVQEVAASAGAAIQSGVTSEVQAVLLSLPPPPARKHSIHSMQSLEEGMPLPVAVRFVPGLLVRQSPSLVRGGGAPSSSTRLSAAGRVGEEVAARGDRRTMSSRSSLVCSKSVGSGSSFSAMRKAAGSPRPAPLARGNAWLFQRGVGGDVSFGAVGRASVPGRSRVEKRPLVVVPERADAQPLSKRLRAVALEGTAGEAAAGAEPAVRMHVSGAVYKPPPMRPSSSTAVPYNMERLSKWLLGSSKSIFISGGGGVGKTGLLCLITVAYRAAHRGTKAGHAIVEPTGVSAAIAGGVTLHAFLHLAAKCFDFSNTIRDDADRIFKAMSSSTKRRLATTNLLLLDEVSMVSCRMFSVLIYCMDQSRVAFPRARPWQIIAFGDFHQLPPVRDLEDEDVMFDTEAGYAFEYDAWDRTFGSDVLELSYVWRQADMRFIGMLSKLRAGVVTKELAAFMQARHGAYEDAVKAGNIDLHVTHILPRNKDVIKRNSECLSALEAPTGNKSTEYTAVDEAIDADIDNLVLEHMLDKAFMAPRRLQLCVGARVAMCDGSLRESGVFNGTPGVVVRFIKWESPTLPLPCFDMVPVVRFKTVAAGMRELTVIPSIMKLESVLRDGPFARRQKVPLMLAWGVTVHRVQGLSLDMAVMDLAAAFVAGMVYVCLSRVRGMEGVFMKSFSASKVFVDQTVCHFYENLSSLAHLVQHCVETGQYDVSVRCEY